MSDDNATGPNNEAPAAGPESAVVEAPPTATLPTTRAPGLVKQSVLFLQHGRLQINTKRRLDVKKAFQKLWVAGTVGAFFSATLSNLALHIRLVSLSPDWAYTGELFLRYAYVIWLLTYFFISNVREEAPNVIERKELFFDVIQSASAFCAAMSLNFIWLDPQHKPYELVTGVRVTNVVILLICGVALRLFSDGGSQYKTAYEASDAAGKAALSHDLRLVNALRVVGVVIAVATLALTWSSMTHSVSLIVFLASLAVLSLLLWAFIRLRYDEGGTEARPAAVAKATA